MFELLRINDGLSYEKALVPNGLLLCYPNARLRDGDYGDGGGNAEGSGMLSGSLRVSKADGGQTTELQHDALRTAGVDAQHPGFWRSTCRRSGVEFPTGIPPARRPTNPMTVFVPLLGSTRYSQFGGHVAMRYA